MRKILFAILMALTFVTSAPAPARAQMSDADAAWVNAIAGWSAKYQAATDQIYRPLQSIPVAPDKQTKSATKKWVKESRVWTSSTLAQLALARQTIATLPPPPPGGPAQYRDLFETQKSRMPMLVDSVEDFVRRYDTMLGAFEADDPDAIQKHGEAMLDAASFVAQRAQDQYKTNIAALTPGHPQRHLFLSASASYDAMLAQIKVTRESLALDEPPSRAAASAIMRTSATTMRLESAAGRKQANIAALGLAMPLALGPSQEPMRVRMLEAVKTYHPQFDNEEEIARRLDRLADTLDSKASFAAVVDSVVSQGEEIGALDTLRVDLVQKRILAMQGP